MNNEQIKTAVEEMVQEVRTMERVYYTINEAQAKQAKRMTSFYDYVDGSKTKEYKSMVDEVYDLAEKVAEKRPSEADRVAKLADRYARQLAEYFNNDFRISCMCPSVMISGAGNFPVKKKEKQNQAWDRNYQFYKQISTIPEKIENILYMKEVIKAGDENALEKLQEKLEKLEANQQYMKDANAYYRKHKTLKGYAGIKDEDVERLDKAVEESWHQKPYASYELTNNNANIKRIKARIASLETAKEQGSKEEENEYCKIVENTEIMRLQLIFDGKPSDEIRTALKANGFRWSPKNNNAWQRQLNNNARYALERVMKQIKELEGKDAGRFDE